MINWIKRSGAGLLNGRSSDDESAFKGPSLGRQASWLEAFRSHWAQGSAVMQQSEGGNPVTADQITIVFSHADQMVHLLLLELNHDNSGTIGPILDELFTFSVFEKLVDWGLGAGPLVVACQTALLKLYESFINQAQLVGGRQSILVHKPILQPLLLLLESCSKSPGVEVEKRLVILLNQICVSIAKDSSLLEFFFDDSTEQEMSKFSVFSLLVPFLYREGDVGQFARDSVLLILSASRKSDGVGRYIAEHSNFCPVLATGLSGLYSTLPRKLSHSSDDWHCITRSDVELVPELATFYSTLEFCNAVVQVGHKRVRQQLLDYIYYGFLMPVIAPALNQPSLEEIVTSTAYLEMFLRAVTEPALVRVLVRFLLSPPDADAGLPLLEALLTRISSNSRLCLVSLSLFNTLLDLNCEDLMYELVLKYLIPCTHVMVSQTKSIRPMDVYSRSSEKFLSLIPNSCLHVPPTSLPNSARSRDSGPADTQYLDAFDSLFASPSGNVVDAEARVANGYSVETAYESPVPAGPRRDSAKTQAEAMLTSFDDYLKDARDKVKSCYVACMRWSQPYDGVQPEPALFRDHDSLDHASSCATLTSIGTLAPDGDDLAAKLYANSPLRQSNMSVSNSYFTAPRLSSLFGYSPYGISSLELTLGQEDFFIALEGLEPLELNSHGGPKGSEGGGSSSTLSTPVHSRRPGDLPPPTDYLKLTYDEDSHGGGYSAGEDYESDFPGAATTTGLNRNHANPFVLVGWSQVQDQDAFVELLNRVRSGSRLAGVVPQAHMDLIDELYERVTTTADDNGQSTTTAEENTPTPPDVADKGQKAVEGGSEQGGAVDNKGSEVLYTPLPRTLSISEHVYRGSFKNPNVGPFVGVVLHKLEHMMTNSLFVNLRLTGLIARLAVYPQPLLASFLLSDQLVYQPSVKSLFQILSAVKHRVDAWALSVADWQELLVRGRAYLAARLDRFQADQRAVQGASFLLRDRGSATKSRSFSLMSNGGSQPGGGRSDKGRRPFTKHARAGSLEHADKGYRYIHRGGSGEGARAALELMKTKNVVYCAIVLEDFAKELAAIAQEHSISAQLHCLPAQFV